MRLIDADALKKVFHAEWDDVLVWDESGETTADQFCNIVDAAPTITDKEVIAEFLKQGTFKIHIPEAEPFPEPVKRGKWIEEPNCWYRCSLCGEHYPSTRGYMYHKFCPNCGAKMDNT